METFECLYPLLSRNLLKSLSQYGFEKPSLIQSQCLLPLLLRRDCIIQAPAGSGKTGVFGVIGLALIEQIKENGSLNKELEMLKPEGKRFPTDIDSRIINNNTKPYVLIISPTRELAQQTQNFMETLFGSGIGFLSTTVGKLNTVNNTNQLRLVILDEADRLLSEGFLSVVESFLSSLNPACTIQFFSATFPKAVVDVAKKYCVKNLFTTILRRRDVTASGFGKTGTVLHYVIDLINGKWMIDMKKYFESENCVKRYHNYYTYYCRINNSLDTELIKKERYGNENIINDDPFEEDNISNLNNRINNENSDLIDNEDNEDINVNKKRKNNNNDFDNNEEENQSLIQTKVAALCKVLITQPYVQCVVFANKRTTVDAVYDGLKQNIHESGSLSQIVTKMHGGMNQEDRQIAMEEFKTGKKRIVIATDLWARGLDVRQVNLVINFDMADSRETFVHRCGRAGRFGSSAICVSLI